VVLTSDGQFNEAEWLTSSSLCHCHQFSLL